MAQALFLLPTFFLETAYFLIIGSEKQFAGEQKEQQIKAKTFELYRRDSRNIEIITYDELFERAKFIVSHSQKQ